MIIDRDWLVRRPDVVAVQFLSNDFVAATNLIAQSFEKLSKARLPEEEWSSVVCQIRDALKIIKENIDVALTLGDERQAAMLAEDVDYSEGVTGGDVIRMADHIPDAPIGRDEARDLINGNKKFTREDD